jgi:hypothetical protein
VVVCPMLRGTNHHDYIVQAVRKVIRERNSFVDCCLGTRVTLVCDDGRDGTNKDHEVSRAGYFALAQTKRALT